MSVTLAAGHQDHGQYDCFVLVVMTHGDENDLFYGTDGQRVQLTRLMEPIKKCRTLVGKPKICIVQVRHLI